MDMELLGLFIIPNWIIAVVFIVVSLYLYLTWNFNYFISRGIPGPKPKIGLGNLGRYQTEGFHKAQLDQVRTYGKVHGYFTGRKPIWVISDINILRHIFVKDFSTFMRRRRFWLRGIAAKSLFDLGGDEWKRVRGLLTPAFTSGKMRKMDSIVRENAETFVKNMEDVVSRDGKFEAKQYTGGFTMDVIASTAFGLQIDSQKDKNNPFTTYAKKVFDVNFTGFLMKACFMFEDIAVPIFELLGLTMFPKDAFDFFEKVVNTAIKQHQNENVERVDLLSLMLKAHHEMEDHDVISDLKETGLDNSVKKGLTDEEILAQCLLFFLAGYDTTASTLSFLLYNLATHQNVQDKVLEEIKVVTEEKGLPTYDNVNKMTYLDMCVSETLRMYPPVVSVDRRANNDVTFDNIVIPKDATVLIPIYAIQNNPEVWPEPEKFVPERFTAEAKASRDPFNWLPFGMGPRQCAGMRLAQLEMRIVIARLLQKFRFLPSEKTEIPIKLKKGFFSVAENGIHLKVERR